MIYIFPKDIDNKSEMFITLLRWETFVTMRHWEIVVTLRCWEMFVTMRHREMFIKMQCLETQCRIIFYFWDVREMVIRMWRQFFFCHIATFENVHHIVTLGNVCESVMFGNVSHNEMYGIMFYFLDNDLYFS